MKAQPTPLAFLIAVLCIFGLFLLIPILIVAVYFRICREVWKIILSTGAKK